MNLKSFTNTTKRAPVLLKNEISTGDRIVVKTMNSVYVLTAGYAQQFWVSGGYFEKIRSCKNNCDRLRLGWFCYEI